MERLPLASIRTFSVVARLLSITRAAEELKVTPSAVSHQIKLLEEYLSTTLFRRDGNKLRLTPAGEQYMVQVSEGLLLLACATKRLKASQGQQVLRVAVPPTIAVLWLIERVGRFMGAHPDIALTLTASPDPPPLLDGSFDVAFWYGSGVIPGVSMDPLGRNYVFPICKRDFINGEGLRTPGDLARCTLIDSADESYYQREARQPSWHAWLQAAGIPELTGKRYLNFTPRLLAHRAVVAGLGVGLGRTLTAVDALCATEVVVPFGPVLAQSATYNLLVPAQTVKRKDIAAFRSWVLDESRVSSARLEKMIKRFIEDQQ